MSLYNIRSAWKTHIAIDKKNGIFVNDKFDICFITIGACSCKLTKEAIVQHYTSLEKNLQFVDKIIETFGKFEGFDDETKSIFQKLLSKDTTGHRIERFLQQMLDLHDSRLHLCLLEREMWETNPTLLKEVIKAKRKDTGKWEWKMM